MKAVVGAGRDVRVAALSAIRLPRRPRARQRERSLDYGSVFSGPAGSASARDEWDPVLPVARSWGGKAAIRWTREAGSRIPLLGRPHGATPGAPPVCIRPQRQPGVLPVEPSPLCV